MTPPQDPDAERAERLVTTPRASGAPDETGRTLCIGCVTVAEGPSARMGHVADDVREVIADAIRVARAEGRRAGIEEYRRGFHVGDRVSVVVYVRGGRCEREGVIRSWSWGGRNFSEKDDLPGIYLCADVEFKKRDGSGTYRRGFDVVGLTLRALAKETA